MNCRPRVDDFGENSTPILMSMGSCDGVTTEKLIPTLEDRVKYVCHYRNLKQYLKLWMKLVKIHRILQFEQTPWLKKYIDFNSEKRKHAKNDFEKDFFKLMNNAVFGKTMENVRKRVDIKLTHNEIKFKKYVARPSFKRFTIFDENLTAVENQKVKLTLNKPVNVGQAILDLSKVVMYDFYYGYLKETYGNDLTLLMTDTDSLLYHVTCDDVYSDMYRDRHKFDLSNYPSESPYFDQTCKKVPGFFKDECGGNVLCQFVGLRAKMYSYKYAVDEIGDTTFREKQIAKGIKKATIKRDLRHEMYKECLFKNSQSFCQMATIRSDKHQLYVYCINKAGLCAFDDKRFVLDNGVATLAFGHYSIQ
ncbi:uncharacterized protein [Argopecten irradians]|uniref:uncharacterized protein n=1 Tax=Argopecten irradians TaxID=31199 RepID=UPI0037154F22